MLTFNPTMVPFWRRNLVTFACLMFLVQATTLSARATFVAPEWKAHLKGNFVIENCVFEETSFTWSTTNLYHAKYQRNAFLIREITSPEAAPLDHIQARTSYAGRFGSNYWAIEGGRVLKLFPNAEHMVNEFRRPEVSLIEAPRSKLIGALFYGFYLLDPVSVEWVDELNFVGFSFRGTQFRGTVLETSAGLPTLIEWHPEAEPMMQFTTECRYVDHLDLGYYPSHILVRGTLNGQTVPVLQYHLMSLQSRPTPLSEDAFDPERYFAPDPPSVGQVVMVTNNQLYVRDESGAWRLVLPGPLPPLDPDHAPHRAVTRAIMYCFVGFSILVLIFALRRAKRQQQQNLATGTQR